MTADLFRGLDPGQLGEVMARGTRRELAAGETLFELGAEAKSIFVIESGRVALTLPLKIGSRTRSLTLMERTGGTAVGWSALVPPYRYTQGGHAITRGEVLQFEAAALRELFECRPRIHAIIATSLAAIVAGRLGQWQAIALRNAESWVLGNRGAAEGGASS